MERDSGAGGLHAVPAVSGLSREGLAQSTLGVHEGCCEAEQEDWEKFAQKVGHKELRRLEEKGCRIDWILSGRGEQGTGG